MWRLLRRPAQKGTQRRGHLFLGLDDEQALSLWRLTHPRDVDQNSPVSVRQLCQFSTAAKLLARQCGKPDEYFKRTATYKAQIYWLRRRLLRRSRLLTITDSRHSIRARFTQANSGRQG